MLFMPDIIRSGLTAGEVLELQGCVREVFELQRGVGATGRCWSYRDVSERCCSYREVLELQGCLREVLQLHRGVGVTGMCWSYGDASERGVGATEMCQ